MNKQLMVVCLNASALFSLKGKTDTTPSPLTTSCIHQINDQIMECIDVYQIKWNITEETDPKCKQRCCYLWDVLDCDQMIAKVSLFTNIFYYL